MFSFFANGMFAGERGFFQPIARLCPNLCRSIFCATEPQIWSFFQHDCWLEKRPQFREKSRDAPILFQDGAPICRHHLFCCDARRSAWWTIYILINVTAWTFEMSQAVWMASLLLHHYWKTLLKKGFPDLSQNFYGFFITSWEHMFLKQKNP